MGSGLTDEFRGKISSLLPDGHATITPLRTLGLRPGVQMTVLMVTQVPQSPPAGAVEIPHAGLHHDQTGLQTAGTILLGLESFKYRSGEGWQGADVDTLASESRRIRGIT